MQHDNPNSAAPDGNATRLKTLEAIARGVVLRACYNGQTLALAPHALFARRGDLFIIALNLAKKWAYEEEKRLGAFKLAGLTHVDLTDERFVALPSSAQLLAHPDDELVLALA